ncbi:peptidase [Bacillus sp. SM2101]|uniref:peptidase n=1 Tax=Bacillus sp. SM2101 TaxID=2805366 RepID=UPI001BDDF2A2|nr:peptidase [Bacillus sp. SM2101]
MHHHKERIHEWISNNQTKATQLLQKVVQEESTQGNEGSAQAVIIEKCRELGLQIDIWEPSISELTTSAYFVSTRKNFINSPNVVAVLKGSGGGRSIILNGHIDVVPEGDHNQWDIDPYSGEVKNGRLYGRGSTDMKGGNIALLLAIDAIKGLGIKLKGDVIFQSVIEEESGGAGTLATLLRGYKADAAIIPEPTNMKIFPKQQGSMWFRLMVKGRAAHGGTRYEGVSAIEKSMSVVTHIEQLEKKRNENINDPLYANIPIPIPINIGKISGGTWPSSVADTVIIEGRMGVAPNESLQAAQAEMKNWLTTLSLQDSWFEHNPVDLEWFGARWVPGTLNLDHELINVLSSKYRLIMNEQAIVEASPWGTDGGLLSQVGDIPTVVFGPGVTEVAHYPNEFVELDKIFQTAEIIALTVLEWCGVIEENIE